MPKKIIFPFFVLFSLFFTFNVNGQSFSNYRYGSKKIDSLVIKMDSLSIVPETFSMEGIEKKDYTMDYALSTLYILNPELKGQMIFYHYRVFNLDFSKKVYHRSTDLIISKKGVYTPYITSIEPFSGEAIFNESSLQSTGSISRGIAIGNNQDLVLNSTLNLQLSGMISDDIEVNANITDKNVPIQPDGNSRVIQDFDKIFIQLNYKNQYKINAGDIDVDKPFSYFMQLSRRVLGMELIADHLIKDKSKLYNKVGGGIAKGKYIRRNLVVQNGVQGPYRLTGEQNETAIVIIAGSERIYMDGVLLVRGQENDYTIDYNSGELTFSSKNLMTHEKRIVVEYEYSDRNYARYNLYTFNEFVHEKHSKLRLTVNFFHEQDLKNQSIQPELNNEQKKFLASVGDQVENIFYPNIDTAFYNPNEILYKQIDTTVDGISYRNVYVYSVNKNEQLYRLGFSYVGNYKGNYKLVQNSANGRVFAWVAPVEGVAQGSYEPVLRLNTPKLTQMATIGAEYGFLKNSGFKTELAISNYDRNTFSKEDSQDNMGFAYSLNFFHAGQLKKRKEILDWRFNTAFLYQFVHKNFHAIESYREVEFDRDYNLSQDYATRHSEQMIQFNAGFSNAEVGSTQYFLNFFSRFKDVNALRNEIVSSTSKNGFTFHTNTSYLFSNDSIQHTDFIKTANLFSKEFGKIKIGIQDNLEYNVFKEQRTDLLRPNSYAFNEAVIFLKNSDSLPYLYSFAFKNRIDHILKNNVLQINSMANEAQVAFELTQLKNNRIRGNATYRNNKLKDTLNRYHTENYFVGSIEYSGRFFKNALTLTTYYEAGSGLEQKRTFTYLKVADGQGTYLWNDYNHNGIEEIDEFEIAVFQDQANYIKVWLSSNEYINIHKNQFTQTLQLRPANVWKNKKGFLHFLSRFSNSTTLRIEQSNRLLKGLNAYNPFNFKIEDSSLVNSKVNFINTFSFNQNSSYFGIDFIIQEIQNKNLLFYGFETSTLSVQELIFRGNPHKSTTLRVDYSHSVNDNDSEYIFSKQYKIATHKIDNSVQYHYKNVFYGEIIYCFKNKKNRDGDERLKQHNVELNLSYRMAKKGNLNVNLKYINIRYNSHVSSALTYEMLEGLNNGNNAVWMVSYQANITDYLQINAEYNGRVSELGKVIHTGNLQIRAHF